MQMTIAPSISGMLRLQTVYVSADHIPVQLIEFDLMEFRMDAYRQMSIACPDQIARSVFRRRVEFFFGRLAASCALSQYGAAHIQLEIGPQRAPIWPSGITGSISHSDRFAAAAVIPHEFGNGLGLDIERRLVGTAKRDVEYVVLDEDERRLLGTIPLNQRANAATLAFSAKESFFKAVSASVDDIFGYEVMRIDSIDLIAKKINFSLVKTISDEFRQGTKGCVDFLEIADDHYLTLYRRRPFHN
ncbi:4'-phosphopantetheinyl transferase [Massilia aurea]|uniref:4'-phosphopantetheinyl transferase family protein n=1 Tax=Massilia aurea TaxID=373040 RepID=UPI00216206D9|nr:4'-phosphopantetheinyl transferase superfamily protein [Massilia aurea]MCS0709965.1 4'-phosphopantetheinyl transferase superfamily protein [Massilia aurea]